jgi:hypothetical protein
MPECANSLEGFISHFSSGTMEYRHPYHAGVDLNFTSLNTMQEYEPEVSFDAQNPHEVRTSGAQVDEIVSIVTVGRWEWSMKSTGLEVPSAANSAK